MIGVVLDTNIVVSANLKPKGLEAYVVSLALNRRVRHYLSAGILDEYDAVLRRPEFPFVPDEIDRFLRRLRTSSRLVRPALAVAACAHEADNKFLECAETAKADFLVTGNTRHFPKEWKSTKIATSREFLEHFAALQSE